MKDEIRRFLINTNCRMRWRSTFTINVPDVCNASEYLFKMEYLLNNPDVYVYGFVIKCDDIVRSQ